jgi:DNA-binding transcriptional regulator YdaS (Cro superfamily)
MLGKAAENALKRAIKQAGGVVALANTLGIRSQAISQWNVCPVHRAIGVEQASGVPKEDLRPDIYPRTAR